MKQVIWFTPDRTQNYELPAGLDFEVNNYLISADGWCQDAELTVQGKKESLRQLLNLLWYKLEIVGGTGTKLWWGYASRIELYLGKSKVVVDLQEVNNSVAVAYTLVDYLGNTLGVRYTTLWQTNPDSIARFGQRELLLSAPNLNTVAAEALAKCRLAEMAFPAFSVEPVEGEGTVYAKLFCEGDWKTLDTRYCEVPPSLALSYQTIGTVEHVLLANSQIAQSFNMTSEINAIILSLYAKKVGDPGDLVISLNRYVDVLTPGESIASVTINKNLIGPAYDWISGQLQTGVHLTASTQYFLVISSTLLDAGNYYAFKLDGNTGYGNGSFIIKMETGNWVTDTGDMPFRIYKTTLMLGNTSSSNQATAALNPTTPKYMQTFTPAAGAGLRGAKLYLKRVGTPGDLDLSVSTITGSVGGTDTDNASLPFKIYKPSVITSFTNPITLITRKFTSVWSGYGQYFAPASTTVLREITVWLQKVGNPGSITLSIDVNNGSPLVSKTIDASQVSTAGGWVTVLLDSELVLTVGSGQVYAFRLMGSNITSSNYYNIRTSETLEYPYYGLAYSTVTPQWYAQNYTLLFIANTDTLGISYTTMNSGAKQLGFYIKQLFQPIVSTTTIEVLRYGLYVKKVGSPGVLKLAIISRTDGYPGSTLLEISIAAASVPTTAGWLLVYPPSKITLSANTTYYLSLTGESCDASNYYEVQWDTAGGYSGGKLLFTPIAIGSTLASTKIESVKVGASPAWVGALFGNEISLTAGQGYALTLSCSTLNASNYYEIYVDLNKGYTTGTMFTFMNSKWWSLGQDFMFEIDKDETSISFNTYNSAGKKLGDEWVTAAQSFLIASNIELSRFAVYTRKVGTPGKLNVALCALENNLPGAVIISTSIDAINVTNTFALNFLFPQSLINLTAGVAYFLVLSAQDCSAANYYELKLDTAGGYASGSFVYSLSAGWSAGGADMPFRIYQNEAVETTQQIANILTTFGETLKTINVLTASQILSESFRNGDSTALTEVIPLLELGTINNRRLIARVNTDLSVDVWEQPSEPSAPNFELHEDGRLYYASGEICPEGIVPIGEWISIEPILYESMQSNNTLSRTKYPCIGVAYQDGTLQYLRGNIRNQYSEKVQNG